MDRRFNRVTRRLEDHGCCGPLLGKRSLKLKSCPISQVKPEDCAGRLRALAIGKEFGSRREAGAITANASEQPREGFTGTEVRVDNNDAAWRKDCRVNIGDAELARSGKLKSCRRNSPDVTD
jgi:hypothetical protein